MQEDTGKRTGSHVAGAAALGFLLVYFLFPVVFIWPLVHIYGPGRFPPAVDRVLGVFFWPVIYLDEHIPPYRRLLEKEAKWIGIR